MSAARHLELVADPAGTDESSGEILAENQFIGSLMWLPRNQVEPLLALVPDTAIWHPIARWADELIAEVTDAGDDPTPIAVKDAGRHRRARNAIAADRRPSARQQQQLAKYLFEAYSQALAPRAAARSYARDVLDDAYRRGFDTYGSRMQELAASGADRADLTVQFTAIRDELAALWRLAESAAQPERNSR